MHIFSSCILVARLYFTLPFFLQVCYFRYLRFYPSGRFLYKVYLFCLVHIGFLSYYIISLQSMNFFLNQISSHIVKEAAKYMNFRGCKTDLVFSGHYTVSDDKVGLYFFHQIPSYPNLVSFNLMPFVLFLFQFTFDCRTSVGLSQNTFIGHLIWPLMLLKIRLLQI